MLVLATLYSISHKRYVSDKPPPPINKSRADKIDLLETELGMPRSNIDRYIAQNEGFIKQIQAMLDKMEIEQSIHYGSTTIAISMGYDRPPHRRSREGDNCGFCGYALPHTQLESKWHNYRAGLGTYE
jgi:hypothetical protein